MERWLLLVLLPGFFCQTLYSTRQFISLQGKRADPCHIGLTDQNPDCTANELPWSAVTIWTPSNAARLLNANAPVGQFFEGAGYKYSILGRNLGVADTAKITLSTQAGRCSAIDNNIEVLDATVDTGVDNNKPNTDNPGTRLTFAPKASWLTSNLEIEDTPRAICYQTPTGGWVYTGFKYKVVWPCEVNFGAGAAANARACPPPSTGTDAKLAARDAAFQASFDQFSDDVRRARSQKTICCPSVGGIGQCINPNTQSCCGVAPVEKKNQRCCQQGSELVQWNDAPCPCTRATSATACPAGETCCLPSKYPTLNHDDQMGECYNPATHQCCDVGSRFDPGTAQCCVINGLQSLNIPCPCASDAHCRGNLADANDDANFKCCRQTNPVPWEAAFETVKGAGTSICDINANFPSGTGPFHAQPCLGTCYNSQYQICCNGATCISSYERCCNTTCCDKYKGTCQKGRRPGAPGQWNNPLDYDVEFEVCSVIEQMNTVKAFWVFVWPAELMGGTFVALAIALGFASHANKYATAKYKNIERLIIAIATLASLFAIPLFFAPLYKYGTLIVLTSVVAIVTAASRVRWLNVFCVLLHGLLVLYILDPFHANILFNFSSMRTPNGNTDPDSMGILHVTRKMWRKLSEQPIMGSAESAATVTVQEAAITGINANTRYVAEVTYLGQTQMTSPVTAESGIVAFNQKLNFHGLPRGPVSVVVRAVGGLGPLTAPNSGMWAAVASAGGAGNGQMEIRASLPAMGSVKVYVSNAFDGAPSPPTDWCTSYFDFFKFDSITRDERLYNPLVPTFGYCSRGWVMALFLFEGGIFIFVLTQFVLTLVGLVVRFKEPWSPVHLEARY